MTTFEPKRLEPTDSRYPEPMRNLFGALATPDIWYLGNLNLLRTKGVGFCGSRHASKAGLAVAADCATQLSQYSITVVSGYAAGVDMASHEAALANGGNTIIVLPEGIDHFRIKKAIKQVWDWQSVLVISYFPRPAVWRPDRAMERNKVIVALSRAVLVLEAGDRGGTLNAGFTALEMEKPLFVAYFEQMIDGRRGNRQLIEHGGIPLQRSNKSGHAELRHMLELMGSDEPPPAERLSA